MNAKVRAAVENANERPNQQKPASRTLVMESLVATEAELKSLYEEIDQAVAMSYRMSPGRTGI
jgi:hypothetical protein